MNAVGLDVSKGKSTVCVMRPFGEIVVSPFETAHTISELSELAKTLKSLNGETKVIMECTGNYHLPVAHALREAGLTVCAVHAQLIYNFGNNTIRKVKTDKADAIKIANYGLKNWLVLPLYVPEDEIRHMLKTYNRQYNKYTKLKTTLKSNLISLLDQTFPGVNELFSSPSRESDGHQKWLDFALKFWHCECVCGISQKAFSEHYRKWCKKSCYNFSQSKADDIYASACGNFGIMPKTETTKLLITQAVIQINAIAEGLLIITNEMKRLATLLPEYSIVLDFRGIGVTLAPQLMAEIGDIYRFSSKQSLVCFAGLEPKIANQARFQLMVKCH